MSVLLVKTSAELTALEGTATAGDTYFNSDTKNIRVWDGTNWRMYLNDGISLSNITNTYSIDLDGTNEYLTVGSETLFNTSSAFSFSGWVKLDTYTNNFPTVFGVKTNLSNGFALLLSQNYNNYYGVTFGIGGATSGSGTPRLTTNSTTIASDLVGSWTHICLTFDGVDISTGGNGAAGVEDTTSGFKLYINNSLKTLLSINEKVCLAAECRKKLAHPLIFGVIIRMSSFCDTALWFVTHSLILSKILFTR